MKTWKQLKLSHHRLIYKGMVEKFAGHDDDRQIFVNSYNMILEALESLDDEPNLLVTVAMNHEIRKMYDVMDEIVQRFRPE